MPQFEALTVEASEHGIEIIEKYLRGRNRGFYSDGVIVIDKRLRNRKSKSCILAEEIGHHHTTFGCILDQTDIRNRKQELRAREWAYNRLIPLQSIIDAHRARVKGRHDIADYLGVSEAFLQSCIDRYADKYGLCVTVDERYIIYFDPLAVAEIFEFPE